MAVIKTQSLTKKYGSLYAVRNLNLEVDSGEIYGFLGPNGAGKSTTINMLLDFTRPTSGKAHVLGLNPQDDQRAIRDQVGVLSEASGYYKRATAREHIQFAIAMKRTDDDPDAILDRVGIIEAADRRVAGFSTGMRQRLGLGMALVGSPELLILDEPLSGLDPTGARLLREIIRTERNRGAAVFFSSHIMAQVEALCDRVGIMHNGNLVASDTIANLQSSANGSVSFIVTVEGLPTDHNIENVNGVTDVIVQDQTLRAECSNSAAKAEIIRQLDALGGRILDVNVDSPSFEEIFMAITEEDNNT